MVCTELHGGVHTAQRQRLMQISIGFCTYFISIYTTNFGKNTRRLTIITAASKLGQGDIFTGVCDSVHGS